MMLTVDSYAWIEAIRGTPEGHRAVELMESADGCTTASISLAEVAQYCQRVGLSQREVAIKLRWIEESARVEPLDSLHAIAGAWALLELRASARRRRLSPPGLGDGLVLATARLNSSRVLTGDPHFEGLPETIWLKGR
jgi:predicted nucleic acid-binding protein